MGEASLYPCALSLIAERYPAALADARGLSRHGSRWARLGVALGGAVAESLGWRNVFSCMALRVAAVPL